MVPCRYRNKGIRDIGSAVKRKMPENCKDVVLAELASAGRHHSWNLAGQSSTSAASTAAGNFEVRVCEKYVSLLLRRSSVRDTTHTHAAWWLRPPGWIYTSLRY